MHIVILVEALHDLWSQRILIQQGTGHYAALKVQPGLSDHRAVYLLARLGRQLAGSEFVLIAA